MRNSVTAKAPRGRPTTRLSDALRLTRSPSGSRCRRPRHRSRPCRSSRSEAECAVARGPSIARRTTTCTLIGRGGSGRLRATSWPRCTRSRTSSAARVKSSGRPSSGATPLATTPTRTTWPGSAPADPELARSNRMLADGQGRANRRPIPVRLTGGRAAYHASLMFVRKHLPHGDRAGALMPIWVNPKPTGLVLLVPAAYGPPRPTTARSPHGR